MLQQFVIPFNIFAELLKVGACGYPHLRNCSDDRGLSRSPPGAVGNNTPQASAYKKKEDPVGREEVEKKARVGKKEKAEPPVEFSVASLPRPESRAAR